jgi:MFS family permease
MNRDNIINILWAMIASFATYSCMYAFRKPLTAATFDDYLLFGISYKVLIIITQVLGYLSAKFIGIKVISELKHKNRALSILILIAISNLALLLFAITPFPYNFLWIFFNGLPLGFIWGIVFSYIEGRKVTDILATFLSISFIVSSGFVKSIGRYFIESWKITEFWMPFVVGTIFLPLIILCVWMLEKIPKPSEEDIVSRSPRISLNAEKRKALFISYAPGLIAILLANMLLTVCRDIKDNFLVEIFKSIGLSTNISIYTQTETIVGITVLLLLSMLVFVQKNKKAFFIIHLIMLLGISLMFIAALFIQYKIADTFTLVILHGIGLYSAYIVFQSLYFERFIATFKIAGNVGFLIYLSDFVGYLGSCFILILKEFSGFSTNWAQFFILLSYIVSAFGIISVLLAMFYFNKKSSLSTHL